MADITKINLNGTVYTIVDSAATAAISAEETRAKAAESANTSAISAEVVARQSADTALEQAISGKADASTTLSGYGITDAYTKTEVDNALSGKADTATTLSGYGITDAYTKTEVDNALAGKANTANTYTKTEVDNAITAATSGLQETLTAGAGIAISSANVISCTIDTGLYVVVQELPAQPAAGNENKIHLVPLPSSATGQNDQYEEYLWKGDEWEYLGVRQAEIDLSGYWTSAQTQSAITNATSGKVDTSALTNYYTSAQTDSAITAATSGKVDTSAYTAYTAATDSALTQTNSTLSSHIGNTNNPHQVTAAQIGVSASYSAETETLILTIPSGSTS